MTFWQLTLKNRTALAALISTAATFPLPAYPLSACAESLERSGANVTGTSTSADYTNATYSFSLPSFGWTGSGREVPIYSADREAALTEAPAPASSGGSPERPDIATSAESRQSPFSRIGIGADVSPLGIGLKSAIVLNHYFDARLMGDFFSYRSGSFEIEGFNVNANLHLASGAASLDWYPFNSIWRLSPGLLFFNDNRISGVLDIAPGTSFSLNGQGYYSASANQVTGATPLRGNALLGLHTNRPAATITGGFGKFIPRSNRHWSFPSEFGVAFTGAPSISVNFSGSTCLDAQQTQCSNLSNPANPVTAEFDNDLQTSLKKWRRSLNKVQIYPLFSYSVVYSFNIR